MKSTGWEVGKMTDPISAGPSTMCEPCQNREHIHCTGWGISCECINSIHRVYAEKNDDIARLAGRIRGCALLLDYDLDDTKTQLEDIARRIDGVADNLALVAHLLNNPTATIDANGILRVALD